MTNEYLQIYKSRHCDAKIRHMQFVICGNNLDCIRFSFRVQLIFLMFDQNEKKNLKKEIRQCNQRNSHKICDARYL